ncbi:endonuclease/exonuclease/phosphatase family protein [Cohaesibacter intestini]|uniref:endonuclease/exonuclease/phosphatase family protein n=1 Tax=Cohaesibacter intestini TaxID=2211145 RepID=UPI000DE8AD46|nr:endonuclease/exonuclease/phosphatase family protein [Cohaesibacter intestini]
MTSHEGTNLVSTLTRITDDQKQQILASERVTAAHDTLLNSLPAMRELEVGGAGNLDRLPQSFAVAAWNVERCLFPDRSAAHLANHAPSVVLLSEMDKGMARTSQVNTTAQMAKALGMHYAYGVEFFEMDLGGPTERVFCSDSFNADGWHGNGILSAVPFEKLALFRLDEKGHWFSLDVNPGADPDQPRVGGRMAVAAILPTEQGAICVVSTHLESNADAAHRHSQFADLLDRIEAFAPGLPVLIGGDLNTGNHIPPDYDWRVETLFDLARERGYHWDLTADGVTTRNSLITPHDTRRMKLDWFCARGFGGEALPLLPSLDGQGPLSDHECILCKVTL